MLLSLLGPDDEKPAWKRCSSLWCNADRGWEEPRRWAELYVHGRVRARESVAVFVRRCCFVFIYKYLHIDSFAQPPRLSRGEVVNITGMLEEKGVAMVIFFFLHVFVFFSSFECQSRRCGARYI